MNQWLPKLLFVIGVTIASLQGWAAPGRTSELAPIQLTPERRQLIGVTFATVERRDVTRRIDATGNVEPDEQLQSYVQTRFAGWIQQVFVNQTFQYVRRGQPLFTVYSPDLASTEQEYVSALRARDRVAGSSVERVSEGANSLAEAAAERLALMSIPKSEVSRLADGGKPRNVLTIYSPASGYVVDRSALPNMYVQPETKLYTITDFSTVWVYAAVFQDELGAISVGDRADFAVDAYPGDSFVGRVDYVWPQIDMTTRTARVRVAFGNRDSRLKPGMYGRITLQAKIGERTVIPAGGVLRTGTHNVAFIDRGDGYFVPIDVELGPRVGNNLVVLKGLEPGQKIVASANFLIDSESQLQAATGNFVPPPAGVSANAAQPSEANPAATLEMLTIPNPPARGKNQVRVILKDSHGHGIDGANVSVTFYMAAMPAMGMSAIRVVATLTDQGGGAYEGALTLESGGTWQVTGVATKEGRTLTSKQFSLSASGM
jgi:Cu(I)/Ag(I) efflux system membrane fusion protein/cobalt-zinc-cadmium efflux system membrane fusion protein